MKGFLRYTAHLLTVSRIAAALCLPAATGNAELYILYTYCSAIDIANGALARRCGTASRFGAALDSAADFIFLLAALCAFADALAQLPFWGFAAAGGIAACKLCAYAIGFFRFHRFCALHTRMNKLCGAALFCAGYWLPHMPRPACSRRSPQGRNS